MIEHFNNSDRLRAVLKVMPIAGFLFCLFVPSIGQAHRVLGNPGVVLYFFVALLIVLAGYKYLYPAFLDKVDQRQAKWLTLATFVGLLVAFVFIYPIADSGVYGGGGDRDDALNVAVRAIFDGEYPYYSVLYTGNPIRTMPGAWLLASPFVLIGNSAFQNFFWVAIFFVVTTKYLRDIRKALLLSWCVLLTAPVVLHDFVTGADLLANSLYVMLFMLLLVNLVGRSDAPRWQIVVAAVLLGIGLASRGNYLILVPLVFSALIQQGGWRAAITYLGITGLAIALINLPFYIYDTEGFIPAHMDSVFARVNDPVPILGQMIIPVTIVIAVLLSLRRMDKSGFTLLWSCAIVQAFPVFTGLVLESIRFGDIAPFFSTYGMSFLFFGTLAFGIYVTRLERLAGMNSVRT